ncbi:AraC family transcriptional regulator [Nocardia stercoris]|uniref:AraC family transcriptional regulator n=1 Tax=Nocardia stercoris TaxID=2483361 RepID=A0A3M2LE96_9NOCA|nr:AraC family transcriptional regulator [Nocardia stercoris]RMI35851.1 AraC family transcriptional regulator [Nocardia stercoris]
MDVLSDLLIRARVGHTDVHLLRQSPPWSLAFAAGGDDEIVVLATLGGPAHLRTDSGHDAPLGADAVMVVKATGYTVADNPATAPQALIKDGRKILLGSEVAAIRPLAARTYGDGSAHGLLRGAYRLHGAVGARLLDLLPEVSVTPADPRVGTLLNLLAAEASRSEPGQDAVLHRLLESVLVLSLRGLLDRPGFTPPGWYLATADPQLGGALQAMHDDPGAGWTVATLAAAAGLSRARFAARFTEVVGHPPLTYLTEWRMTLAADALRDTDDTVAAIARRVGYGDPFAFSVAFKRVTGVGPSAWRRDGP